VSGGLTAGSIASNRWQAFGGTAVVAVADPDRLSHARAAVQRTIDEFDRACSRFRPDSELSALNAAAGSIFPAGPVLLDAVQASLRAARVTDGDVDPTVGAALIALGYDRDFDAIVAGRRSVSFAAVPGWRTVALDRGAGTIRLAPGVTLDLGATAKALAADRAAAAAHPAAACAVLVSFSGDISIAGAAPEGGWAVRVTDDHRSGQEAPGQSIVLAGGGLATSSTTARSWPSGGEIVHHLIDPRTGGPAQVVWRTVSVTAVSCLDANIASTAAVVRGESAPGWLASLQLSARLVGRDGTVRHVAGWPFEGEELPVAGREPAGAVPS
jgi:thiamine biosynthesis lipoprotein